MPAVCVEVFIVALASDSMTGVAHIYQTDYSEKVDLPLLSEFEMISTNVAMNYAL
jgi:hypothetical protein